MSQLDPTLLGFILVVFGLSAALLTLLLLQKFSQSRPQFEATPNTPTPVEDSDPSQAILIVQPGGRISYINRQAREWFDAWEEVPSLERLSRKITPTNPFIELCVAQGERQFHLDGRLVHVLSYSIPYGDHRATFLAFHSSQSLRWEKRRPICRWQRAGHKPCNPCVEPAGSGNGCQPGF
jgi:hypothetical protein